MIKRTILVLMIIAFGVISCGRGDSDVLATYKGGEITRGEFYKALGRMKGRVLQSKTSQKRRLEDQAFIKFKYLDAKKVGLNKAEEFKKKIKDHSDKRLLIRFFLTKEFPKEPKTFSKKGYKVRHIFLKNKRENKYKTIKVLDPGRFKKMAQARKSIKDVKKLQRRLKFLRGHKISKRIKFNAYELLKQKLEIAKSKRENLAKLKKILIEVNKTKGKNFADFAKKNNTDRTRGNGGLLGFMFPYQRGFSKEFIKTVTGLKEGQISEVLETPMGIHIAMCEKIVTFTEKNFDKYFPVKKDKKKVRRRGRRGDIRRQMFGNMWYSNIWTFIMDTINNDKNVTSSKKLLNSYNKKAVLFEIKHPDFKYSLTLGDFMSELKKMSPYMLRRRYGISRTKKDKNKPFTFKEKIKAFDWYVTFPILKYGAYKRKVTQSKEFKEELDKIKPGILGKMLTVEKTKDIKVTDKEMQDEFKKNKKRYRKRVIDKAKSKPRRRAYKYLDVPYVKAKKSIERNLKNQKRSRIVRKWKASLLLKYAFKINMDELDVVKKVQTKKRNPRRRMRRVNPGKRTGKKYKIRKLNTGKKK